MFCQHRWTKEGARWRDVCIPKQLEGRRRQMLCFSVYVFARWVWRYGGLGRTKSQGQISWLCRGNSWGKQTRKSLHFIKGSAGARCPPTPSITPLLPPVWHQAGWLVSSAGNWSYPNKFIMNQNKEHQICLYINHALGFILVYYCKLISLHKPYVSVNLFMILIESLIFDCFVRFVGPGDELCYFNLLDLLCWESLVTQDQLISSTVAPCSFVAKTTGHFFCYLKKEGLSLWAMLNFSPTSRCFSPVYLNCWQLDDLSATCMKELETTQWSDRGLSRLNPKQTLAQVHTQAVAFWLHSPHPWCSLTSWFAHSVSDGQFPPQQHKRKHLFESA